MRIIGDEMRIHAQTSTGLPYSLHVAKDCKPATLEALRRMMELLSAQLTRKDAMKKKITNELPRWVRKQYVWHCFRCHKNQPGKVRALRIRARFEYCEPCGNAFLEERNGTP